MRQFRKVTKIKGLSEERRLPRLGKIKLGIKRKTAQGKEYPSEVDYFVVPPEIEAIFGKEPKELEIMIPVNDIEQVLPTAYKWYGRSYGLKCIGDGKTGTRSESNETLREYQCDPCPHRRSPENPRGECNLVAHFLFMIPKHSLGGVYQIDTGSINSIIDLQSGLEYVARLVASVTGIERFNMIPLKLKRVPRETHGSGKKTMHYTLNIELAINEAQLAAMTQNPLALPGYIVETPLLTESKDAEFDDAEIVDETPEKFVEEKEQPQPEPKEVKSSKEPEPTPKETPQTKPDESRRLDSPLEMDTPDLAQWLFNERNKRYKGIYRQVVKDLFGIADLQPLVSMNRDKLLDLYDKLEAEKQ